MRLTGALGILGGTFDPVHHGHLRLALELASELPIDRVHLIPAGTPVHRDQPVASSAHRLAMLEAAVEGVPALVVDARETRRDGPSFMVDTLSEFRAEHPERPLCLLLGMDAFCALETWHRWREVIELAHIAVAQRPGTPAPGRDVAGGLLRYRLANDPAQLLETPAGRIALVDVPALDISATRIRDLMARGRDARYLLPQAVLKLIEQERLYASGK